MKSLKKIMNQNLRSLALVLMTAILLVAVYLQVLAAQSQARSNASATFLQIRQLLQQNKTELEAVEADYRETCLLNAEAISYIIRADPSILGNVQAFRKVAYTLQVDEIHIFDETGRIFTGTHPEYFDFTFDSGEQMNFFKPMLTDKTLRLCQDITPNTAEGKLVQYSALWSSDEKLIIQVGMYPDAVLEVTEKNELSYIFSLLKGSPGVSLYAIDPAAGTIAGSSSKTDNGKRAVELGFAMDQLSRYQRGTHLMINGVECFCIFEEADDPLLGYVISNDQLYGNIPWSTTVLAVCLALIAVVLVLLVQRLINQYVVDSISKINEKLRSIGSGNLDERTEERSSQEFAELSDHINQMVKNLLANIDKMSYVLNLTNLPIGVYEYNTAMKKARYTEHIPEIFGLDSVKMKQLASDQHQLKAFIEKLRQEPIPERANTYRIASPMESYLTLEEVTNGSDVLGIVMDVTQEICHLKKTEIERDHDLLTGLFNRRGIMSRMEKLFANGDALGHGAIVMLDADGLKQVNDTYGHGMGDVYLKQMGDLLRNLKAPQQLSSRLGGDEFLMLIYGYPGEQKLLEALQHLRYLQKNTLLHLEDGTELPLRFSYGYVQIHGREDYTNMISEADAYMYNVKKIRKRAEQARMQSGDADV